MEESPRILVVDDEQDLREILEFNLSSEGFIVETSDSAETALKMSLEDFDLILLDVMMLGMSGYKMADIIRKERNLDIPIIFLTAKTEENNLITGFNVGGDDYITKPFSIKEVVVRIKAVLKRRGGVKKVSRSLNIKKLKLDEGKKNFSIGKDEIELTRKEYEILYLLLKNKGNYLSRQKILKEVWSNDVIVTDRNVDVNITRLRKKMGAYGSYIKGKTGYGYCIEDE